MEARSFGFWLDCASESFTKFLRRLDTFERKLAYVHVLRAMTPKVSQLNEILSVERINAMLCVVVCVRNIGDLFQPTDCGIQFSRFINTIGHWAMSLHFVLLWVWLTYFDVTSLLRNDRTRDAAFRFHSSLRSGFSCSLLLSRHSVCAHNFFSPVFKSTIDIAEGYHIHQDLQRTKASAHRNNVDFLFCSRRNACAYVVFAFEIYELMATCKTLDCVHSIVEEKHERRKCARRNELASNHSPSSSSSF